MHDQVTVVVGIDAKTIEYLKVSVETWRLHRPEMWGMKWLLFFDWTKPGGITDEQLCEMLDQIGVPDVTVQAWPLANGAARSDYESQRELMLSGHVWVPGQFVETPWHMKIDADVLALGPSKWLQEEWFAPKPGMHKDYLPSYIAPRWHYTKGKAFLNRLEEWGDSTILVTQPRLNIPADPNHLRVPHQRMCSWVSYYQTGFTQALCGWLEGSVGRGRLPVPSQDTTYWYAAERAQRFYRIVSQKALSWTNCSKLSSLKETAARVLNTNQAASIVDA